jgi:hypothetical protein
LLTPNLYGNYSHAEGNRTVASGPYSHAEGEVTLASGEYSHAEGTSTQAQGYASHAEGSGTLASGSYSHAEGESTQAIGLYSHAEGRHTNTLGNYSHAEGLFTVASGNFQHVQGQYNISSSAQSAFIIGNGTSTLNRSNLVFASGSQFQITGSLQVSGSITGSLFGTASYATQALSASWAPSSSPISVTGSILYSNFPPAGPTFAADPSIANSIFFGYEAGYQTTNVYQSNFLGDQAGKNATNASYSNFIGTQAGLNAPNAEYSNFLGTGAGVFAASASYSTLIGYVAGAGVQGTSSLSIGSNNIVIGNSITLAPQQKDSINLGGVIFATGSYSSLVNGLFSGSVSNAKVGIGTSTPQFTLDVSGSTRLNGNTIITGSLQVSGSITGSLFGTASWAQNAISSLYPISVTGSTLYSTSPVTSNVNAIHSILLGQAAGQDAPNAHYSNFLGWGAGYSASNAEHSYFLGRDAGSQATNANNSNFLGRSTGYQATSASYSTLLGYNVGSTAGTSSLSIGSNNIIIGTNITLPAQQKNSINLGGIIFATGSYFNEGTTPFTGSVSNAKVGICTSTPAYTLDVSGSTRINDILLLQRRTTTPTPVEGMIIASGSAGASVLYYYNGTTWNALF